LPFAAERCFPALDARLTVEVRLVVDLRFVVEARAVLAERLVPVVRLVPEGARFVEVFLAVGERAVLEDRAAAVVGRFALPVLLVADARLVLDRLLVLEALVERRPSAAS